MKFRTRFAPSPTGRLHIGSIQKMLYAYAIAKANDGDYILRIEDTDRKRYDAEAETEILRVHEILGLEIDESPEHSGDYGPYRQSERLEKYKTFADRLIEKGDAYYAFDTPEELKEMREIQKSAGERPRYNGKYRDFDPHEAKKKVEQGEDHVVRLRVPEREEMVVYDKVMGKITVNTKDLDDYILLKSDGFPTYHLAVVVDDHLMDISHVVRGVEWLPTFPVHILLYQAFDWDIPKFFHIPNILDPNGKGKLSKRSGSVAAMDFFAKGYLPEAIVNYMILLGWSPKSNRELFTLDEFVDNFSMNNFNKANPTHNPDKLDWFNQQYLQQYSSDKFVELFKDWFNEYHNPEEFEVDLDEFTEEQLDLALKLEQERISVLNEMPEKLKNFIEFPEDLDWSHRLTEKLDDASKKEILQNYLKFIESEKYSQESGHDEWENGVRQIISDLELKAGQVFMTLRIAITGQSQTPPLFDFIRVIGEEEHHSRVKLVIERLG